MSRASSDTLHERCAFPLRHIFVDLHPRELRRTHAFPMPSAFHLHPSVRPCAAAAMVSRTSSLVGRPSCCRPAAAIEASCCRRLARSRPAHDGRAPFIDFVMACRRALALTGFQNIRRAPASMMMTILRTSGGGGERAHSPLPIVFSRHLSPTPIGDRTDIPV